MVPTGSEISYVSFARTEHAAVRNNTNNLAVINVRNFIVYFIRSMYILGTTLRDGFSNSRSKGAAFCPSPIFCHKALTES